MIFLYFISTAQRVNNNVVEFEEDCFFDIRDSFVPQ